jgi:hypothetical protein
MELLISKIGRVNAAMQLQRVWLCSKQSIERGQVRIRVGSVVHVAGPGVASQLQLRTPPRRVPGFPVGA